MDFESEFYRLVWLVPLPFLLAYILVESGVRLKKGWKRAVLLLAVGGLVTFLEPGFAQAACHRFHSEECL